MPDWLTSALWIILLVVGIAASVPFFAWLSAIGLSGIRLEPVPPSEVDRQIQASRGDNDWAEANGYEWIGVYRTVARFNPTITVLAWQSPGAATFLCVYQHANRHANLHAYDLVTEFDQGVSLTTGSSPNSVFHPQRPGSFVQAFPGVGLDELFARHLEAEEYLQDRLGVVPMALDQPFAEHVADEVHQSTRFMRAIPLWPLRVYAWHATKSARTNRSVAQRYPDLAAADLPA